MTTTLTKAQLKAIARHNKKIARKIAPKPVQRLDGAPITKQDAVFADRARSEAAERLGTTKDDVHLVIAPVGEMLHRGAREYLAEVAPEFLARLDRYRR